MKRLLLILLATLATLLVGCGGGGGSLSTATSGNLRVFVTDDLNTNYDHVWVTIHSVELEGNGFTTYKVFDSPSGVQVDLRSLNNGNSLFSFLGVSSVPAGSYDEVKVEMAKGLTLFATGATTGQNVEFIDALNSSAGKVKLNIPFTGFTVLTNTNLTIDFDLSQWTLAAGKVTPFAKRFNGNGFNNQENHREEDVHGIVDNLTGTAPNFTFKLGNLVVTTDATTVIFREDAQGNAELANGLRVEVTGKFDVATEVYKATRIKIEDSPNSSEEDKVKGKLTSAATDTGFTMSIDSARGFIPGATTIQVNLAANTLYFTDGGAPLTVGEFLNLVTPTSKLEVEGTANADGTILTANKVKIEDDDNDDQRPEVKGNVVSADVNAGTFVITPTEWYGISLNGDNITVTTGAAIRFRDNDGNEISKTDFFALLSAGVRVKVEGSMTASGFSARKLEIRSASGGGGGGGGGGEAEARGSVLSVNQGALSYGLHLVEVSGFTANAGDDITVTMTQNATYRIGNQDVDANAFFAALPNAIVVEVEGSFSNGVLTGTKAKIDED